MQFRYQDNKHIVQAGALNDNLLLEVHEEPSSPTQHDVNNDLFKKLDAQYKP